MSTNGLGQFHLNIGAGTALAGNFSKISWGKNAKFLQVEMDAVGGANFIDLGTQQMMSVPYALHAGGVKLRASTTGDTLYTGGGNYLIIPGISASNPILNQPEAPITDIDGNVYQTVRIGTQVWMKENLKVSKYRNGNSIPTGLTDLSWFNTTSGAYAIYNNDAANNPTYGKLYNWYAVTDLRGMCPTGWHVPTDAEWTTLINFLGGSTVAGGKMKVISSLWKVPNNGATNESGFTAIPGGFKDVGSYGDIDDVGRWWSSMQLSTTDAWFRRLSNATGSSYKESYRKTFGISVRCLKD
jgi:uncharacterized protein (TIGR02145 family)